MLHVKESYQGETFNLVIFTDSLSSLMNLEESNNAYNDPDVYRILSTISFYQRIRIPESLASPSQDRREELKEASFSLTTFGGGMSGYVSLSVLRFFLLSMYNMFISFIL